MRLLHYIHFLKNNKYLLLFGFLCVFIGNLGQTFFISLFNQALISELLMDEQRLSLVYSVATLTSGFTIFFLGPKVDSIDVKPFTFFVLLGLVGSSLLFAFSQNGWMLFLAYLGIRLCGQGLLGLIATTTLLRYIPKDRAKAVSLSSQGMALGEVTMPLLAVFLLKNMGFSNSWMLYSGVTLAVVMPILFWLLHKAKLEPIERLQQTLDHEGRQWTRKEVAADWRFWMLIPAIIAPAFLITALFYHQTFWAGLKNWSLELLATGLTLYGVVHLLGALLAGPLIDKSHPRRYFRWYLLPLLLSVLCLLFGDNSFWLFGFMFFAGLSIAMSGPVVNSFMAEVFGSQHVGAIRSLIYTIMIISTGIAPYLFSLFKSIEMFMGVCAIYLLVAGIMSQVKVKAELV